MTDTGTFSYFTTNEENSHGFKWGEKEAYID